MDNLYECMTPSELKREAQLSNDPLVQAVLLAWEEEVRGLERELEDLDE